ncbi:hypothetical protein E2562_033309 [Oryza meyeriana var. granulata]|uniref:F-box domain-containing protein n=1 Tax=Oryza meyeriana var. granulata TaxID=110450 RepID=A0A6G1F144_9ORYZ|nr:hypothetical protein E2562_033309 [Oryza meyeriana var. granulata]
MAVPASGAWSDVLMWNAIAAGSVVSDLAATGSVVPGLAAIGSAVRRHWWHHRVHSSACSAAGSNKAQSNGGECVKPSAATAHQTWTPGDLLRFFSGRLHYPLDFIPFRAVCCSWRFATAAAPPSFLPWLLARPVHPTTLPSLSSGAAPSATCCLLGHTNSHLLFSDRGHPSNPFLLVNPLTGADLPLPPSPFDAFTPITQGYYLPGPDSPVVIYDARRIFFHHPGGESRNPGGGWTKVPVEDLIAENIYHATPGRCSCATTEATSPSLTRPRFPCSGTQRRRHRRQLCIGMPSSAHPWFRPAMSFYA